MKVQLGSYKGFGFKRPDVNIKNEEINDYINKIRESYKIEIEKEESIEKEDYILIDYTGYHEGIDIPQLSKKGYHSRIGQGYFLDEFEAHLMGKKKGDILKFDLKLPDDYGLNFLCNETVQFEVKILSVINKSIPELNDDIVKSFKIEGVNTINKLKEYAKDKVYYQKMMVESTKVINEIISKIIEGSTVELKDEEIESLKREILEDFKKQIEKKNANLEIYLSYTKKTEEEVLKQCELEAQTYLTEKAIIEKIAEVENITLNDEEKEQYKNIEEDIFNELLYQKVIHFLLKENTTIIK